MLCTCLTLGPADQKKPSFFRHRTQDTQRERERERERCPALLKSLKANHSIWLPHWNFSSIPFHLWWWQWQWQWRPHLWWRWCYWVATSAAVVISATTKMTITIMAIASSCRNHSTIAYMQTNLSKFRRCIEDGLMRWPMYEIVNFFKRYPCLEAQIQDVWMGGIVKWTTIEMVMCKCQSAAATARRRSIIGTSVFIAMVEQVELYQCHRA